MGINFTKPKFLEKKFYNVDLSSHNLAITHVFPCLTDLKDTISAEKMESK